VKPQLKDFLLYLLIIIIAVVSVIFIFSTGNSKKEETSPLQKEGTGSANVKAKQYSSLPQMEILQNKKYQANIITTKGPIKIDLFAQDTPVTVNNFVFLAKEGFYDGTIFHRVIKDFMIQGGDPNGDGTGGPGYTFEDEKITKDYKRGIVAMANRGPNTNGSQFFIMHKDYNLPKQYVIFGQVIDGIDTVDKIAEASVVDNGLGEKSKPSEEIRIEKIEIEEI
jgi:peptidylprolyl isomerase